MKIKKLLLVGCFIFGFQSFYGQNITWKQVDNNTKFSSNELMLRANYPEKYELFSTDFAALKNTLRQAPDESTSDAITDGLAVNLPSINGKVESFYVFYAPVMEPELAEKFPELRSYKAVSSKDASNIIHISISPEFGMHIMGHSGEGQTYYVDSYTKDLNSYITYSNQDLKNTQPFQCLTDDNNGTPFVPSEAEMQNYALMMDDGQYRTYRMALACTVEYAAYHVEQANMQTGTDAQKKQAVLAAMNALVTRLNSIFEKEMAIKFVLVGNNNKIIFLTNDNFDNTNSQVLIGQSQTVINQEIGAANYDIGHTLATGTGGGLAQLGAICQDAAKARGVSGVPEPVGDPFVVTIVSHEVGHQLGASHSFSDNENGSCAGNRSDQTAAEPGSGTTIMSYSGLCDPNNVNGSITDAYFHYMNLAQMKAVLLGSSCGTIVASGNATPVISHMQQITIPHSTPFVLTAEATDANNPTTLSYCWEQLDVEASTQPPLPENIDGPNFRSFPPTGRKYKSFPSESVVLAGTDQNNGIVQADWEVLTNVPNRIFKFGITVRDNNILRGGQTKSMMRGIKTANAGPFVITYPNNVTNAQNNWTIQWASGEQKTITWNVAGTTENGVNTANVKISISLNNGSTYSTLVESTPNNGSATITVPSLAQTNPNVRIKIEAIGNIFYTISKRFTIYGVNASQEDFELENFKLFPNPTSDQVTVAFTSKSNKEIRFEMFDFRGRKVYTKAIQNNGSIENTIDMSKMASGVYILHIKDGDQSMSKKVIRK